MARWVEKGRHPLRRKFGFRVDGAWVVEERNQFVWILTYDGPEGFAAQDGRYYASPERKAMDPDPAPLIEKSETYLLRSAIEP